MKLLIELPKEVYKDIRDTYEGCGVLEIAVKYGEPLPHGEWIEHRQYYMNYFVSEYECSNCRDEVWQKTEWHFCPNCGAKMKEGEAE